MSATSRTLKLLRDIGLLNYWCVERFNAFSGRRTDLFNIIDYLALHKGVIGVQSCGTSFSPHVKKLMEDEQRMTRKWLRTKGTSLILIGWRKLKKKKGGKQMVYYPRVAKITLKKNTLKIEELELNSAKKENGKIDLPSIHHFLLSER